MEEPVTETLRNLAEKRKFRKKEREREFAFQIIIRGGEKKKKETRRNGIVS